MGRKPRTWSESGFYHVTARGNNRQQVFREEEDYAFYLRLCATALATYDVHLHHYCLMPNHVHLLLSASTPAKLVRFMHQVQRRYWFHMRRTYRLSGHLFQGRYHSFPIETESYLLEAGRYIERNPLEAQLVQEPEDYPWTSYPFTGLGQPHPFLTPSPAYLGLGPTPSWRQSAWRDYVAQIRLYQMPSSEQLVGAFQG